MNQNQPVPLWRQLQAAASVLAAVRAGESTQTAFAKVDGPLRPAAQALAFHVLRNLGRAQALRAQLAKRAPPPPADALLCTALALAWDPDNAPYEPFTLVDQAVEAAKRNQATRGQANFINACLRRFLRERDDIVAVTDADPVARWNHPNWWIQRLRKDWPQDWEAILSANNTPAPMTLRVNAKRSTRNDYLARLAEAGITATPVGDYGIVLDKPRPVQDIPGFTEGDVSVQDAAAQLAAPLVLQGWEGRQNLRILDACAAPGGKTGHLLELAGEGAHVVALDVDPVRCERIEDNLRRLNLNAEIVAADAGKPKSWWKGELFDAILLDAPCTASGIVRRHPDVRWLRRETDVAQLARTQAVLLDALWPLLKPGGRLLYCTCSVFREEGDARLQTFVAHNTGARLQPAPGHLKPHGRAIGDALPDNPEGDHDGFFYALAEKAA